MNINIDLIPFLFDGEGGGDGAGVGGADATGSADAQATVVYGKAEAEPAKQTEQTPTEPTETKTVDRKAEFDRLIKEQYKDLYDERVQTAIKNRFKQNAELEEKVKKYGDLTQMLASKYGGDPEDLDSIMSAMEEDDSFYEEAAMEHGLTVEQEKQWRKLEAENRRLKEAEEQAQAVRQRNETIARWQEEAEECKKLFPNFDLDAEAKNPETGERFLDLLAKGVDVTNAFRLIHMDEIQGGLVMTAAQTIAQKVTNDIRARGMRPTEAGSGTPSAGVIRKSDPSKFTKADRDEISRRVMAGERIVL